MLVDHDFREACGFLADYPDILQRNTFSRDVISSAKNLSSDVNEELCNNTESYPRGPSFGVTIDHDFRLACGFLADTPHLLQKNQFN